MFPSFNNYKGFLKPSRLSGGNFEPINITPSVEDETNHNSVNHNS